MNKIICVCLVIEERRCGIAVEHQLVEWWVGGSIPPGGLFFFSQPVLHSWCNKVHGMLYPVESIPSSGLTELFLVPASAPRLV